MRKLPFILGPLLIVAGGWVLLMVFLFPTMIDPALQGWNWWGPYLRGVFLDEPLVLILGVVLVVLGFRVAASGG